MVEDKNKVIIARFDKGKSCLQGVGSHHDGSGENHRQRSLGLIRGAFAFFVPTLRDSRSAIPFFIQHRPLS